MPVWKCFNLSWLVILALILLCGLTQGLGILYFFIRLYFFLLLLIAIEMVKVMWLAPSGADTRDASWITGQRAWTQQKIQPPSPPHQLCTAALLCNPSQLTRAEHGEGDPDLFPGLHLLVHILLCLCYIARCNSGSCKEQSFCFTETAYKSLCFGNDLLYITNTCSLGN